MDRTVFHGLNANNLVLILVDFSIFLIVFLLSILCIYTSFDQTDINSTPFFYQFLLFVLPLHLSVLAVGLYNEKLKETRTGFVVRVIAVVAINYITLSIIEQCFPHFFYSKIMNEILALFSLFMLLTARLLVNKFGFNQFFKRNILILGAGEKATIIKEYLCQESDYVGINFIGFWPLKGDDIDYLDGSNVLNNNQTLMTFVRKNHIHEIVIANDENIDTLPFADLFKLKQKGIALIDILDFIEKETGQVAVDHLSPSWFIYQNKSPSKLLNYIYWLFNVAIAILIGLLTSPLMLVTALLIKLEGGWRFPILYSQERVGLDGHKFSIYKFTSMRIDAEKTGIQWAQENDPRVTKVGKAIRKFRIDELPQLYNVIVGDMFFVGPRPERPHFTEDFQNTIPYYAQRHNVKPGLTGWAQLKYPYGSSEEDAFEKLKFDLYYVKKRNFFLDLLILLKTSEIILFGKGR